MREDFSTLLSGVERSNKNFYGDENPNKRDYPSKQALAGEKRLVLKIVLGSNEDQSRNELEKQQER